MSSVDMNAIQSERARKKAERAMEKRREAAQHDLPRSMRPSPIVKIITVVILIVALIYFLLPRQGIHGFLVAFTLSHGVNFFLSLRRLILVTGYLPRFRATLTACLCCGLCLLLFRLWPGGGLGGIALRGCGFLVTYALLLRLTGALEQDDLRWLRSLILRK